MSLKDIMAADLSAILQDWDTIVWNAVAYKGVFHNEYEAAALFGGEIESRDPYVEVKESDFSGITHADTVTIDTVVYHIKAREPDGTGLLILRLSKT